MKAKDRSDLPLQTPSPSALCPLLPIALHTLRVQYQAGGGSHTRFME
eukprot:CAMPEP_0173401544 /NCGR_PEP_ID=MMETSP1356-20130122/51215_1 /TAXON_ID=77927 ORGANISM="Hemiselmis virescens, Strain PCC157" /NCGR_SAMPLE_ID=MMETSP1356 /ASSEMBLY_ACC=CAM_ASM_000847 /LENGTH=46 /DNA_ID= /DNA_START= /DNA_END= /DNA_ORIENTATION=